MRTCQTRNDDLEYSGSKQRVKMLFMIHRITIDLIPSSLLFLNFLEVLANSSWDNCLNLVINLTRNASGQLACRTPPSLSNSTYNDSRPVITVALLLPLTPGTAWSAGSTMEAAARLAEWHINHCSDIGDGKFRIATRPYNTGCSSREAAQVFKAMLQERLVERDPPPGEEDRQLMGMSGPGCSAPGITLASFVQFFNMTVISYGAEGQELSDRMKYPTFYRTSFSGQFFVSSWSGIVDYFGWKNVAIIRQEVEVYQRYSVDLKKMVDGQGKNAQIVHSGSFDERAILEQLEASRLKVVILLLRERLATKLICAAYLRKVRKEFIHVFGKDE